MERRRNSSAIAPRDLAWVLMVAIAVILIVLLGFAAVNGLLNPRPYARVVINNKTAADLVAQIDIGAEPQAFVIPADTSSSIPSGDYAEIWLLDRECRQLATEKHGGPTAWQIVTVSNEGVTVEYPTSSPLPFEEAGPGEVCP
jgi:hypothetical protein